MTNKRKNLRYLMYARKSSEGAERQALSIDSQIKRNTERFKSLNIVDVLLEEKSAFLPGNRPVFEEILQRIRNDEADGIISWHPDRLSRNEIDAAQITHDVRMGVIRDLKFTSYIFINSPEGIMMLQTALSQSQYFSAKLSNDVKRGLGDKADMGWMPGTAPLGYVNTKMAERGKNYLKKDPERFALLRKAWDLMLTGNYSPPEILDKLNDEWGFRTRKTAIKGGKPMSRSTIYRMFTNPFYTGDFLYRGEYHTNGKHPPMITHEEFDRVQILLGRKGRPRPQRYQYSYSGLLVCGDCGCHLSATTRRKLEKTTGKVKEYVLYYCVSARKGRTQCSQGLYTNVKGIEEQVDQEIAKFAVLPEFRDWALEILHEEHEKEVAERAQIRRFQRQAIAETQKQLDNLLRMRTSELIDDDEYLREKKRLKTEEARMKGHGENSAESPTATTEDGFEFACKARAAFAAGDIEMKKTIFSAIGVNWRLKDHRIEIEPVEWLVPIREQYPAIEERMKAFELAGEGSVARQKAAAAALRPLVRRLVDDVGTRIKAAGLVFIPTL